MAYAFVLYYKTNSIKKTLCCNVEIPKLNTIKCFSYEQVEFKEKTVLVLKS